MCTVETARTGPLVNSAGITSREWFPTSCKTLSIFAKITGLPTLSTFKSSIKIVSGYISRAVAGILDNQKAWKLEAAEKG